MKFFRHLLAAATVFATSGVAFGADIPKFGKTCVGDSGQSTGICLSSNGKMVSSSYLFAGKYRTKGAHKGCALKGSAIFCSGGTYNTPQGSGQMNPVVVKLANGKPVSIAWKRR